MDLGAYEQIENLEQLAKDNGIEIPRLRGYRLMKDEEPMTKEEIEKMKKDCEISLVEYLCRSVPFWDPYSDTTDICSHTQHLTDFFLVKNPDEQERLYQEYVGIRWDRIHGRKRKILKFEVKKQKRRIQEQYDMWNKYAGKPGILYVHSRMGGYNWKYFDGKDELIKQPWFLGRVDDSFDTTYCDFYAKIKVDGGIE